MDSEAWVDIDVSFNEDQLSCQNFQPSSIGNFVVDGISTAQTKAGSLCITSTPINLNFRTEGVRSTDSYLREDLITYTADYENNTLQTLKERMNPQNELGAPNLAGDSNLRACGVGMYAQARIPGTVVEATFANPQINYPEFVNGNVELHDYVESDNFYAWGGTEVRFKRGNADVSVDVNNIGTGDLICYEVPTTECLGFDFSNGIPPVDNWKDLQSCIKKVACPGASVDVVGEVSYNDTGEVFTMWQEGSTQAFSNITIPDVASNMEYRVGFCNPMPTENVVSVPSFAATTRQIDTLETLNQSESESQPVGETHQAAQQTQPRFAGDTPLATNTEKAALAQCQVSLADATTDFARAQKEMKKARTAAQNLAHELKSLAKNATAAETRADATAVATGLFLPSPPWATNFCPFIN